MQQIRSALAILKDDHDVRRWEAYLDGVCALWCITAQESLEKTVAKLRRDVPGDPALLIVSSRLYPADPALASSLRELFPAAELVLLSSEEEPAPPMLPLLKDGVRHLAVTPAAPDPTAKGYLDAVLDRLVSGSPWDIRACLRPDTPLESFTLTASAEKERLIDRLEQSIAGDAPEFGLLRQRGALLADELLENAIYGAPRGKDGSKLFQKGVPREVAPQEGILFRFGFDGDTLALEMTDRWGTLVPEQVMEYLTANQEGTACSDEIGGRGLFIIWRFFDHFHVSITPGERTVISGDLRLSCYTDPEAPRGFHITTRNC